MNEPIYLRDIRSVTDVAAERVRQLAAGRNATLIALGGRPARGEPA